MQCEGVTSVIPADSRLSREEARRLNKINELETIEFQNRILEIEAQREKDKAAATRDSMTLYEEQFLFECYDEMIEEEFDKERRK